MVISPKAGAIVRGLALVSLASVLAGGSYVLLTGAADALDLARGPLAGLLIMVPIFLFDVWATNSEFGRRLRRGTLAVVVGIRTLVYLVFIVVGLMLAAIATGAPAIGAGAILNLTTVGFSLLVAFFFNVVWQLSRMLGRNVLANYVTGRYHRPRLEERVFLFMDLVGSTTAAERLGPLRFHALLDRIAFDIADAVVEYRGEIYRYVGDEVIVTWLAEEGLRAASCLRAAFAMLAAVDRHGDQYERDFGLRPSFHVALHVGSVVVGEMGDVHREIVFLGDTVNTTARIEAASREVDRGVLASLELIDRLAPLPPGFIVESMGTLPLRGKQASMPVVSLTFGQL